MECPRLSRNIGVQMVCMEEKVHRGDLWHKEQKTFQRRDQRIYTATSPLTNKQASKAGGPSHAREQRLAPQICFDQTGRSQQRTSILSGIQYTLQNAELKGLREAWKKFS